MVVITEKRDGMIRVGFFGGEARQVETGCHFCRRWVTHFRKFTSLQRLSRIGTFAFNGWPIWRRTSVELKPLREQVAPLQGDSTIVERPRVRQRLDRVPQNLLLELMSEAQNGFWRSEVVACRRDKAVVERLATAQETSPSGCKPAEASQRQRCWTSSSKIWLAVQRSPPLKWRTVPIVEGRVRSDGAVVVGAIHQNLGLIDSSDDDAPFVVTRSAVAQGPSRRLVLVPESGDALHSRSRTVVNLRW